MGKFEDFKKANNNLPKDNMAWPLYGAGVESLGIDGKPVARVVPAYGDDELLMRIDALSLCYTDVKEIDQGPKHPRLTGRDLKNDPIIPGHEICMTVVGVGKDLAGEYKVGDRYTMQPDIWVDGVSIPFSFGMDGGYRQFTVIGQNILNGDAGNYLIPIPDDMIYASAAITEPWACVEAAYRMKYRDHLLADGVTWIAGSADSRDGYTFDGLLDLGAPKTVVITDLEGQSADNLRLACQERSITLKESSWDEVINGEGDYDDIILLDLPTDKVTAASKKLGKNALVAILNDKPQTGKIEIDIGRLHYDNIYYIGSMKLDLKEAFRETANRVTLKEGGRTWILGAGGPMGRMHLQRAIESKSGPKLIVASEVTKDRYDSLKTSFEQLAEKHGKELIIVDPKDEKEEYEKVLERVVAEGGFDDIEVMITVLPIIADAPQYLAEKGVINLFAGLKRGICTDFDGWLISGPRQIRFVGHSGSALDDQKAVVDRVIAGELKPELSVAAIGGFNQISDGITAMKNWVYPGKIVIYPHVTEYPLTGLNELKEVDLEIYDSLGAGSTWTAAAEQVFLNKELD